MDRLWFWFVTEALCRLHHCSVTSTYRTEKRNARVGGHPRSWHRLERLPYPAAADLVPDTLTPAKMEAIARDAKKLGVWPYVESDHIHLQLEPPGGWPLGGEDE